VKVQAIDVTVTVKQRRNTMTSALKELREKAGMSQAELAGRISCSRVQVARLEAGVRQVTPKWAERLAPALGCKPVNILYPDNANRETENADLAMGIPKDQTVSSLLSVPMSQFAEGRFLSLRLVAERLGVKEAALASLIGIAPDHAPTADAYEIDVALSPMVRILAMASEMAGGEDRAALWVKHQPIPGWAGKSAFDLVREGKSRKVLDYLEAVRSGVAA
jgi:transcriptional regulator with XRE-family HTH domain